MATTYWTLEYDGVEDSLEEWGLSTDLVLRRRNMGVDVCTVSAGGAMDGTLKFDYGEAVIVRRDRTLAAGVYSGGSIWFQGTTGLSQRVGTGLEERIQYQFLGPWFDFEQCVYQQEWQYYNGDPDNLATQRTSEVFLGTRVDGGSSMPSGEQIEDAVEWAVSCGANCQLGGVGPAVNFPHYPVRDITVAEVIIQMLRWTPDATTWFDYSETPPVFQCEQLSGLVGETITIGTEKIRDLSLVPREDLVLPGVVIKYKRTNTVNETTWLDFVKDKYPADCSETALGTAFFTVELIGFSANVASAGVVCSTFDPTSVTWWKSKVPWLNNVLIDGGSIGLETFTYHGSSVTYAVVDEDDVDVNLTTYPRELVAGQITGWMGKVSKRVTVKARINYDLYADTDHTQQIGQMKSKDVSVRVVLTDATTGTYTSVASSSEAEAVPEGLAEEIYLARATLQHEGTVTLVGEEVPAELGMGNKLAIEGGDQVWEDMLIQETVEEPAVGRLTLRMGPASHIGLADMVELLRANRYRVIYSAMSQRWTGQAGAGGGTIAMGSELSKENSVEGVGTPEIGGTAAATLVAGENMRIKLDSDAQELTMSVLDDAGDEVTAEGTVKILLSETEGSDQVKHQVKLREYSVCDPLTGIDGHIIALASETYEEA